MRVIRQVFDVKNFDHIRLWPFTDLHYGSAYVDEELIRRDIQRAKEDKNGIVGVLGDSIDAISRRGDKRFSFEGVSEWCMREDDVIEAQIMYFVEQFSPIANKISFYVSGNHEDKAQDVQGRNIYRRIMRELSIAGGFYDNHDTIAMGSSGFFIIEFVDGKRHLSRYVIYLHHGYGGGKKPGSTANNLFDVLGAFECDLALQGHRHRFQVVTRTIMGASRKGELVQADRIGVNLPSYMGAYYPEKTDRYISSYAERAGFETQMLGIVPIVFYADGEKFDIGVNIANK